MDSPASSMSDLPQKYQKLATEYSKLRTHNSVLKKAFSDEQFRNGEMKELLKEKDQLVRKLEQEIECLNFRNKQLSKRVGILQDDLSAIDDKSKKNKNKIQHSPVNSENQSILDAELQNRIEENEKLHQKVYVTELEQKKVVEALTSELQKVQEEFNRQKLIWNEKLASLDKAVEKLTEGKNKAETKFRTLQKELCANRAPINNSPGHKTDATFNELSASSEEAKKSTELNIPVYSKRYWKQIETHLSAFGGQICELLHKFSDLHKCTEEHVSLLLDNNAVLQHNERAKMKEFCTLLREHFSHVKVIETSYQSFRSNVEKDPIIFWSGSELKSSVLLELSKYALYLQRLLPYITLCLQVKLHSCKHIPKLSEPVHALELLVVQAIDAVIKIDHTLKLIYSPDSSISSPEFSLQQIALEIKNLAKVFDEIKKEYNLKISIENQLPIIPDEAKTIDQNVFTCIVSLVKILHKMQSSIFQCKELLNEKQLFGHLRTSRTVHGAVGGFKRRAVHYLQTLHMDAPIEIPYLEAIENNQAMQISKDEKEIFKQQNAALEKKLIKLEQDKEHWMLEYQIIQAKLKREPKGDNESDKDLNGKEIDIAVKESIHSLICKLQTADSKAVAYQTECNVLYQRLQLAENECLTYKNDLLTTTYSIESLKDQLQATVKNYEDQLCTMTEHLANMNDKLSTQREEIDNLKHTNTKKSKNK